jgi:hypothetical protein
MQILLRATEEEQGLSLCGLGFKPEILRLRGVAASNPPEAFGNETYFGLLYLFLRINIIYCQES